VEYESVPNLKAARRRLRTANDSYQTRVAHRVTANLTGPVFERFVSLSAILIARAAAKHWRKVVMEQEHIERIKKHNRRNTEYYRLHQAGLAIGAAIKKAVTQ
jgi:hypothetical protein